jgi:MYXO-CTERM domain-containing protein
MGCEVHPDYDGTEIGVDFAMCRLAAPVENVPIVLVIMGCELDILAPDVPLVTTGWGNAPDGPNGIKRVVTMPIVEVFVDSSVITAGGGAVSLCGGDSGGGSFVQLDDGTWRMVAVSSSVLGTPCTDDQAALAMATNAVPWIEQTTGIDVTPCHDADGTWNPGAGCQAFPLDPATGGGAWPMCATGGLSEWGASCGPPAGGPDDETPPTIAITSPTDGTVIPLDGETAPLAVTIDVADEGWGVAMTSLRIDGTLVRGSEDESMPFEVPPLGLPEGVYPLEAVALDHAGNEAVSDPVQVIAGDPPLPSDTSGGDSTTEPTDASGDLTGDTLEPSGTTLDPSVGSMSDPTADPTNDTPSDTSGEMPSIDDGDSGCACASEPRASAPWLAVVLLGLRRRR